MMALSRLSVKAKLIAGFLTIAAITAVVGVIGYYGLAQLKRELIPWGGRSYPLYKLWQPWKSRS
jgi:phosphoglycerate-specific signal transduction histidine kinase